jgi:DNA-binding transcriptional regulator GbsR (MarR family)
MKKQKIESLKNRQKEYELIKNDKKREEKISQEINQKYQQISKLEKGIKNYEEFIKELTIKDI